MNEFISDSFGASGGPSFVNTIYPPLSDTFGIKGTFTVRQRMDVQETFGASGAVVHERAYVMVRDKAGFVSTTFVHITHRTTVTEAFKATERIVAVGNKRIGTLADVFGVSGAFAGPQQISTRLREVFGARGASTSSARVRGAISEVFRVRDRAIARNIGILSDVFTARGKSHEPPTRLVVREVFHARSEPSVRVIPRFFLREVFHVREAFTPRARIYQLVKERFTIYAEARGRALTQFLSGTELESIQTARLRTDVWTADMRTWAMSRYVEFPLHDFIGTQFGAGRDGLYTSSSAALMAYVETGLLRMDDNENRKIHQRKQLRYVYVYGTHTEALSVLVTADLNGERTSVEYQLDRSDVEDARASRCEVGRGFASNYVKFRIGGRSRFSVSAVEIESVPSTRRI